MSEALLRAQVNDRITSAAAEPRSLGRWERRPLGGREIGAAPCDRAAIDRQRFGQHARQPRVREGPWLSSAAGGSMTKTLASLLSACALLGGGAAMLGAAAQDRTQYPGQSTQGKVWVQNRGDAEAVPVSIQNVASGPPLRVQVTGAPT